MYITVSYIFTSVNSYLAIENLDFNPITLISLAQKGLYSIFFLLICIIHLPITTLITNVFTYWNKSSFMWSIIHCYAAMPTSSLPSFGSNAPAILQLHHSSWIFSFPTEMSTPWGNPLPLQTPFSRNLTLKLHIWLLTYSEVLLTPLDFWYPLLSGVSSPLGMLFLSHLGTDTPQLATIHTDAFLTLPGFCHSVPRRLQQENSPCTTWAPLPWARPPLCVNVLPTPLCWSNSLGWNLHLQPQGLSMPCADCYHTTHNSTQWLLEWTDQEGKASQWEKENNIWKFYITFL